MKGENAEFHLGYIEFELPVRHPAGDSESQLIYKLDISGKYGAKITDQGFSST